MIRRIGSLVVDVVVIVLALGAARVDAQEALANRGHDPFFQISNAIAACPTPLGPLVTEQQWLDDSHYRIERGNSCWIEGRCRLPNAYLYDAEIADTVRRRLAVLNAALHWREQSTLWLTLQRRFIYVEGCVAPAFDTAAFIAELARTADVERVIDNTVSDPHAARLPYRTLAAPDEHSKLGVQ